MSDKTVLVDTSAWLSVAHPLRGQALKPLLSSLQTANSVATNWLIRVELLTGARDEQDYQRLNDQLSGLHQLWLHDEVWRYAARLRFELRRNGLMVPIVDLGIASSAIVYGCELLHVDRHFDLIAKHSPLKVYTLT